MRHFLKFAVCSFLLANIAQAQSQSARDMKLEKHRQKKKAEPSDVKETRDRHVEVGVIAGYETMSWPSDMQDTPRLNASGLVYGLGITAPIQPTKQFVINIGLSVQEYKLTGSGSIPGADFDYQLNFNTAELMIAPAFQPSAKFQIGPFISAEYLLSGSAHLHAVANSTNSNSLASNEIESTSKIKSSNRFKYGVRSAFFPAPHLFIGAQGYLHDGGLTFEYTDDQTQETETSKQNYVGYGIQAMFGAAF